MPGRLLDPADHPKKEVREILVRLVKEGWTVRHRKRPAKTTATSRALAKD